MILLLTQIWGFLLIAGLIGFIAGGILMWPRRSARIKLVEQDLRNSRERGIGFEKEVTELRHKLGELEGVPEAERRSRIAVREELIARIAKLETDVSVARTAERQTKDEADELRRQLRSLSAQLQDERNKPTPVLELTPAPIDMTEHNQALDALKAKLDDATRVSEAKAGEAASLKSKLVDLEGRVARALEGARDAEVFKTRVFELEAQLRQDANSSSERFSALTARNLELEAKLKERDAGPNLAEMTALRRDAEQMVQFRAKASDLELKLTSAERRAADGEDARLQANDLRDRVKRLEAELAAAARDSGSLQSLQAKIADLETQLSAEQSRASADALRQKEELRAAKSDADRLLLRLADAEAKLEPLKAQAADVTSMRVRLADAEQRLADSGKGAEDASLLRAKITELEARNRDLDFAAKSAAQSGAESSSLRTRIAELERSLGDAQRAKDEAAILRAQLTEMDGRLGTALRAAAEAETLKVRVAALEGKPA